jgi:HK97 gp10 family phage protein
MSMTGRDGHIARLRRLTSEVERMAGRVVYVGSDMIRAEAFRSISAGSVSGRNHVPSAPGQAPNRDTGVLQSHIVNELVGPVTAEVRSEAPYAAELEMGTSKMAARPYMRPARDKMAPKIRALFAKELGKIIKGSGA